MDLDPRLEEPWLLASWPGMGAVAQLATDYLVKMLGAREVGEIGARPYFDVKAVEVQGGLMQPVSLPRGRLYGWKHPEGGRDLLIFRGEMQPPQHGHRYCEELLDLAREWDTTRVVTFAALASGVLPRAPSRVLGAATAAPLLEELERHGVAALEEGQIGGLNGVLLAVAAGQGLKGLCLLGELPFFATGMANPKASVAVLRVFSGIAHVNFDLEPLELRVKETERVLADLLEQLERGAGNVARQAEQEEVENGDPEGPSPEVLAHIEALFEQAAADREHAMQLKVELDRHGLFRAYEDRFLDLFKEAE